MAVEAMGETNQIISDKVINITGESHIELCMVFFILYVSLDRSFTASLNGWNTPVGPTLLGPNRKWPKAIIFRSIKVKKATDTRIGTNKVMVAIFKGLPLDDS